MRTERNRLTEDWSKINSPDVRIATIDGETGDLIARTQFPNAKRVSLPQLTDISQLFLRFPQTRPMSCSLNPISHTSISRATQKPC